MEDIEYNRRVKGNRYRIELKRKGKKEIRDEE
jgi:hypothetical protein